MGTYTLRPSEHDGMVDVCFPGVAWNGIDGLADRFALYDWQEGAREYAAECNLAIVSETAEAILARPVEGGR